MPTKLNRDAYAQLVAEDIAWLRKQPRSLEREHILLILQGSIKDEYGPIDPSEVNYCSGCNTVIEEGTGLKSNPDFCSLQCYSAYRY